MRRSTFLLICAGVLWGTGGLTGHALADATGLSALAVGAYRLALGGLLLTIFAALAGVGLPVGRAHWQRTLGLGALAAIYQAAYFAAVSLSSVAIATLIAIGSSPIGVVVVESVRDRGRPITGQLRQVGLGVAGLALLVGAPQAGTTVWHALAGALLAVVSGLSFALFVILGRVPLPGLGQAAAVGVGFLSGGVALAGIALLTGGMGFAAEPKSIGLLALFVTVPTALAYGLYFIGLSTAAATTAVIMALLEPLTATVLSVILLHEHLSLPAIAGALLLLAAVVDSARAEPNVIGEPFAPTTEPL